MFSIFESIGRYTLLMQKVFSRPEKMRIYYTRIMAEMEALGLNSIGLTAIISVFIGSAVTLQMAITLESPFIPQFMIGYATREVMILEFSSTVVALILAGKVGSNIASEIGTMRITEQIDALEIMGVNSASYLILPKIVATVFFLPIPGNLQYAYRNCRRLRHRRDDWHYESYRVYRWFEVLLLHRRDMVCTDEDGILRILHHQHIGLLRLLRQG